MTLMLAAERAQQLVPQVLRMRVCAHCNQLIATRLCDWRGAGRGRPCDKFLCDACATTPAAGKDLCKQHAERWDRQQAMRRGEAT